MSFDENLFRLLNTQWTHPTLDFFFVGLTDFTKTPLFYVLLPLILGLTYRRYQWRGLGVLFLAVLITSFGDALSSEFLKPLFARTRPEFSELSFEIFLRRPSEGSFSFPSSHALDAFALASFISVFSRGAGWVLSGIAALVAYSRIYCGLHFPSDVIFGAIFGIAWGLAWGWVIKKGLSYA